MSAVCSPPEHVLASRFHLHIRTLVVLVDQEAEGSCALAAAAAAAAGLQPAFFLCILTCAAFFSLRPS